MGEFVRMSIQQLMELYRAEHIAVLIALRIHPAIKKHYPGAEGGYAGSAIIKRYRQKN